MSYSAREPSTLRFGRYEVLFRIAAGGMAEVYAARMVGEGGFEKPVALKRMLPTLAEDERFVQMFLDEGRLAAHISSPHVVQTLDLGRAEDDSLYLVMELVVGVSLSALLRAVLRKGGRLPVAAVVDILSQAAMGLHDAHEARTMYGQPLQIVHRDVSPQNILVDVSGRVRITDFGVARALERATHTQSGEVKGKIGYFAPEQVKGRDIDRRTDVFALGIVAWETLAGRRLFAGDNPAQTLDFVLSMPVPRLDALRPDVPSALADAVAHALERDLDRRTPSAGDFAEELRYALRPSGTAVVAGIVREHGGESLMKLEEGLRAQSPSSLSRVRRSTGSPSGVGSPGGVPGSVPNSVPSSVPSSVPGGSMGMPGPLAAPGASDVPWGMDNAATREIVAPSAQAPSAQAAPSAHGMSSVSGGFSVPLTGTGAVPLAPQPSLAGPSLAGPSLAGPSLAEPSRAEPSRAGLWVLLGAAAVGTLGALGVAGWYLSSTSAPPEPRTMALPPLSAPAVSPTPGTPTPGTPTPGTGTAAPSPPTTATTSIPTSEPAGGAVQAAPTPSPLADPSQPSLEPADRAGARRGRPGGGARTTTGASEPLAASERPDPSTATTMAATTMASEPPEEPPAGTRMTTSTGTGMSTGLVGVSDFERELGLE